MNIEVSSIAVVISFCAGILGSGIFYFREKSLKEAASWIRITLFTCRFFVVFILFFLLFKPITVQVREELKKPIFPVLVDNSKSISLGDSLFTYEINQFLSSLESSLPNVELKVLPFSKKIEVGAGLSLDKQGSDILACIKELNDNFSNENLGGVILISDGICTEGQNDLINDDFPLYCLGVGDSTVTPDATVKELFFNDFVFEGNEFAIESNLNFKNLKGFQQHIEIQFRGEVVFESLYIPKSNDDFHKLKCLINASKGGEAAVSVLVKNTSGEFNKKNNYLTRFVSVKEKKINLLVVTGGTHPDVRFVKSAFWGQENVEIETASFDEDVDLKLNSAVVFVGNSSSQNKKRWLKKVIENNKGFLWLTGTNGGFDNEFFKFIRLDESNDQVLLKASSSFSLFKLNEETKLNLQKDLPIDVPFGKWNFKGEVQSLMIQEVNGVLTNYPQIVFSSNSNLNYSVFIGENYWRLGLKSGKELKQLIRKSIDYVSTKADNSRFRLKMNSEFLDNEEVEISAEFYNKVNELDNIGKVSFVLMRNDSNILNSELQKTKKKYRLNLGELPSGVYNLKATLLRSNQSIIKQKRFVVNELKIESENLTMNSEFLNSISDRSKGEFWIWKERSNLLDLLNSSKRFKSVSYFESITDLLLKHKWVFYILILIVIIEWGIRKWQGAN